MREDDEDVFAGFGGGLGVDEGFGDVGVVHVEVAAEDAPEDSFEDWDAGAFDCSCYESVHSRFNWGELM